MSCDGIPCTGTETFIGAFTGTQAQNGVWTGKANGSVDVAYPNSMGKDGDNGVTCSAFTKEIKLVPGFTDTDL